ncbi:methyltransferase domain-containing protein [Catenulispora sp. NF23]|uniref:Methyltransferase domain-containing protein n=1 Tax=Catenulispora pinistramenti TaxID=2705254 RepID=A0ABS5KRC5_9ACTN|nr:class I SAM-dependent methyltransferase [Catenulispora pinistramenti]MBS2533108.1 methyltransferase domain-containing protein [Catenulispora pinistramenti]MBS2548565.1 methyltransferase domain-containing protein [Catenulispora pinistramenti]
MQAFTDRWVNGFAKLYEENPLGQISWFTGTVSPVLAELVIDGTIARGQRVVDLGCGAGVAAAFLARHGMTVTGVDNSATALGAARHLSELYGVELELIEADILATTLPAESVDVVNDSFIYHNVRPEARTLYAAEVARILKPGGLFVMVGFSDRMTPGSGPIRLTSDDVLGAFLPGFEVEELRRFRNLPTQARPDQWHWLGLFRKRGQAAGA